MIPSCTRLLTFDAAHRIMQHESKCRFLHGHRYVIEATFVALQLDTLGRVVDFGFIYQKLGNWVNEHWDHATILYEEDRILGEKIAEVTGQPIIYLPCNPTAENMAMYLLHNVCPLLFTEKMFKCVKIRLYETQNCYAEASI